jgi:hypothetical protein
MWWFMQVNPSKPKGQKILLWNKIKDGHSFDLTSFPQKLQRQLHKKTEKTEERDGSWELFFQLCDITKVTIVNNLAVIRISKEKFFFTYFWVTHWSIYGNLVIFKDLKIIIWEFFLKFWWCWICNKKFEFSQQMKIEAGGTYLTYTPRTQN